MNKRNSVLRLVFKKRDNCTFKLKNNYDNSGNRTRPKRAGGGELLYVDSYEKLFSIFHRRWARNLRPNMLDSSISRKKSTLICTMSSMWYNVAISAIVSNV